MKTRSHIMMIFVGVFIGVVTMLIVSANVDGLVSRVVAGKPEAVVLGSSEPVPDDLQGLQSLSKAFAHVAKIASPAVVTISSSTTVRQSAHPFMQDPFFRRFFDIPDQEQERTMNGLGSGVIVNAGGYILTNNHVIENADEITVNIDKKDYDAKVVGRDPASDLAVIKIEKTGLPTIKLGDSDQLEVGEWVMAIGNPFMSTLNQSVTAGIVSAKGRSLGVIGGKRLTYQDFIQTDAAINPGNSGGALVNLRGELVGINAAILGQANVGIGFAIPVNLAKSVMDQLINKGKVSRGWLGVYIEPVDEDLAKAMGLGSARGALVRSIVDNGPAGKAGLQKDDIILKVKDMAIDSPDHLTNYIGTLAPNTSLDVVIWRDGKEKTVTVKLGERPSDEEATETEQPEATTQKLGLSVQDFTQDLAEQLGVDYVKGVVVSRVLAGSVADRKGIEKGDIITSVNNKPIRNTREFNAAIKSAKADDVVLLRITRGDISFLRALRVPKDKDK